MATQNTTVSGLPYPDKTSYLKTTYNDIALLAKALDIRLTMTFSSPSDRDAKLSSVTGLRPGATCFTTDTGAYWIYDGAGWKQLYPNPGPAVLTGTTVPTSSTGKVGDIYLQVI